MFGKDPHVNPLALRRQLLVAESDINRLQLSKEWQTVAGGLRGFAGRARTIAGWVSSAALLVAGVTALGRGRRAPGGAKPSWFKKVLGGLRVASTLWLAFRGRGEHRNEAPD
jgi:hypothetical protein